MSGSEKAPEAKLFIVVEYDTISNAMNAEIGKYIESAIVTLKGLGRVTVAKLEILKPTVRNYV